MVTGHRELVHPGLVAERLAHVLGKLGASQAISGGARGADAVFADVAVAGGYPLHLMLPNRWYRSYYPGVVSDVTMAAAEVVTYVVERPDVADWRARWGTERWWRDNFSRNTAMIVASDVTVIVSPRPPHVLLGETSGGTAGCVKELRRRRGDEHRVVWGPDCDQRTTLWTSLRIPAQPSASPAKAEPLTLL